MDKELLINEAEARADELMPDILDLSHTIYEHPELAWHETFAADLLDKTVTKHGFMAVRGSDELGLHTAIRAEHEPKPEALNIGFISEFDALPIGHACGHNLIAASGIYSAIIFDELVRRYGLPANSIFLGTPAEEGGGGKIRMLDAGMFDGIDYAMMIHPCDSTMVEDWSLAGQTLTFQFHGRSAHCAASPWLGANALSAALEFINMVNAWRAQFKDFSRVFPNVTHGGEATNVIPDFAEVKFNIRSDDVKYHDELIRIIENCAECAAKAFEVSLTTERTFAYAPVANSPVLEHYMKEAFERLGETVIPRYRDHGIGSTDMGNVTQKLPGIHGHLYLAKVNTHTKEFLAAAGGEDGDIYVGKAVKAMILTAIGLVTDPEVMENNRFKKGETL